jgi:hypothetical protein
MGRMEEWKSGRVEGWKSGRVDEWEGWKRSMLPIIHPSNLFFHPSI